MDVKKIRFIVMTACALNGVEEDVAANVAATAMGIVAANREAAYMADASVDFCPRLPNFQQDKSMWRRVTVTEYLRWCGVPEPSKSQVILFGKWVNSKVRVETIRSNGRKLLLLPSAFVEQSIM